MQPVFTSIPVSRAYGVSSPGVSFNVVLFFLFFFSLQTCLALSCLWRGTEVIGSVCVWGGGGGGGGGGGEYT